MHPWATIADSSIHLDFLIVPSSCCSKEYNGNGDSFDGSWKYAVSDQKPMKMLASKDWTGWEIYKFCQRWRFLRDIVADPEMLPSAGFG